MNYQKLDWACKYSHCIAEIFEKPKNSKNSMKNNAFHNHHTKNTKKLNENQCFYVFFCFSNILLVLLTVFYSFPKLLIVFLWFSLVWLTFYWISFIFPYLFHLFMCSVGSWHLIFVAHCNFQTL